MDLSFLCEVVDVSVNDPGNSKLVNFAVPGELHYSPGIRDTRRDSLVHTSNRITTLTNGFNYRIDLFARNFGKLKTNVSKVP